MPAGTGRVRLVSSLAVVGLVVACVPPGADLSKFTDSIAGGLATIAVGAGDPDPDRDGLSTYVERNGYSVDLGGKVTPGWVAGQAYVNLPAMGANPLHKDLFVHVDYMDETWKLAEVGGMALAREMFARSPVTNPDGRTGIALHLDEGPDSVMNPRTGQKWGDLSRAGLIPREDDTVIEDDILRFQGRTPAGRPSGYLGSGRGHAFRYGVMAHNLDGTDASGIAGDIPSSVFVVALGQNNGGRRSFRLGTFLHELGHTLGLAHGGGSYSPPNKPNFQSLMTYPYQGGLARVGDIKLVYDYSRERWDVNENALDETAIIPGGDYHVEGQDLDSGLFDFYGVSGNRVDWNGDLSFAGTTSIDLDHSGTLTSLDGHADWSLGTGIGEIQFAAGTVGAADIRGADIGVRAAGILPECMPAPSEPQPGEAAADATLALAVPAIGADKLGGPAPLTVNFDSSATVPGDAAIASYAWDFGDGGTSTSAAPQHTFATPGVYEVELGIVDVDGDDNEMVTTQRIEVTSANTAPIAGFHADAAAADPTRTANFDGRSSVDDDGTVTTWQWDFGDGATATGATPSHTYAAVGTYTVKLKVTDDLGATAEASATLQVSQGNAVKVLGEWARAFLPLRIDQSVARRTEAGTSIVVRLTGWNAHDQRVVIRYLAKKQVERSGRTSVVRYWKKIGTVTTGPDGTAWVTLRPRLKAGAAVRISAVGRNQVVQVGR